ncbi:MFS transporter [Reticulibacter mediterranei]|uniref:MFS transporter n=1 Tax=Reticulibacter mediterranei TaxID=2778369 RepID=A0A8J3INT0_9CHLR|nr:MFS transporter [Reticulibacter mediterranei]GHO94155.1 MFS transporter [Reticulibacter mediterranei]
MSDAAPDVPSELAEQPIVRRTNGGYAYYVFWVMFGVNFLNYLDRYVLTGAANVMAGELHFDLSGIGYITSAFLIVYTLCALPMGIWADRARRKDIVALSVAVWSVTTALTTLATNFWTLFLSRMILGVGEAGYYPAGTALLSDYFNRARRSRIMSWWGCAQLVGILGGYGIGGTLAGLYPGGWRLAFLLTGIPGLVLAFLMWRVREPRRNQADEEENSEAEALASAQEATHMVVVPQRVLSQFWTLLRIRSLFVLIVMQVFAFFVLGVNTTFLPTYLQQKDTFGLSSTNAGLYSGGVIVVAGIAGTILGGYLADILNRRHPGARVLVCGIGFLLSAPAFALAVTTRDLLTFTLFFVLTALLLSIYLGPSTAATQDVVPSALRASAVSLTMLIAHLLGDAFAPSIVGVIATSFDPTHGGHFAAGYAGQDLNLALLFTCTPALLVAGLIGIFGARWMATDILAAEQADKRAGMAP